MLNDNDFRALEEAEYQCDCCHAALCARTSTSVCASVCACVRVCVRAACVCVCACFFNRSARSERLPGRKSQRVCGILLRWHNADMRSHRALLTGRECIVAVFKTWPLWTCGHPHRSHNECRP